MTLTGIRYRVGTTPTGNVQVALYNAAGTSRLAASASAAQSTANTFQNVAFTSTVAVSPGSYWAVIQCSAACQLWKVRQLTPTSAVNPGSFTLPTTITAPTNPENTDRPILYTY